GSADGAPVFVGVNIGKTKIVPEGEAIDDYTASARLLAPLADYLVVNVSSPNTPGLRDLQAVDVLRPLLLAVRTAADEAAGRHVPLLVKIAPDWPTKTSTPWRTWPWRSGSTGSWRPIRPSDATALPRRPSRSRRSARAGCRVRCCGNARSTCCGGCVPE